MINIIKKVHAKIKEIRAKSKERAGFRWAADQFFSNKRSIADIHNATGLVGSAHYDDGIRRALRVISHLDKETLEGDDLVRW